MDMIQIYWVCKSDFAPRYCMFHAIKDDHLSHQWIIIFICTNTFYVNTHSFNVILTWALDVSMERACTHTICVWVISLNAQVVICINGFVHIKMSISWMLSWNKWLGVVAAACCGDFNHIYGLRSSVCACNHIEIVDILTANRFGLLPHFQFCSLPSHAKHIFHLHVTWRLIAAFTHALLS